LIMEAGLSSRMKRTTSIYRDQAAVKSIRLLAIPVLIISALVLPACAPQPSNCSRDEVFCVGVVTAFDGIDDHGLNQATWEALQDIETQAKIARLDMIESIDSRDWTKNILFFADKGYDVIVTVGVNLSEATIEVASEYPHIFFIGIDQREDETYANVATLYFAEEQAGFLAGTLASLVTQSDRVGAVCETSGIDSVWRYCEGFRAGVAYGNEEVRAYIEYRESGSLDKTFNDPDWGEERMLSLLDDNVDVMTGFGGGTAEGAFLTASEKGILVIGAEGDLYYRLPDVQPVLITSIIKDPSAELSKLILWVSQGNMPSGPLLSQIELAPFRLPESEGMSEIQLELKKTLEGIRNGKIEITLSEMN
jgi:basic membrane protein A